jgi:hypothetical protein
MYLRVFNGFQKKQRLFPYTVLTYFFITEAECLLSGTDWVFNCDRSSLVLTGLMLSEMSLILLSPH